MNTYKVTMLPGIDCELPGAIPPLSFMDDGQQLWVRPVDISELIAWSDANVEPSSEYSEWSDAAVSADVMEAVFASWTAVRSYIESGATRSKVDHNILGWEVDLLVTEVAS